MTPMTEGTSVSILVMGVQGVGKSTIGVMLAERLGVPFVDGDRLHPERNIELMAAGTPLTDEDRDPWLHEVGKALREGTAHGGIVIACSALKREYRDLLRAFSPEVYIVEPYGEIELIAARISGRNHEYMPPELLQSQYDTLEPLGDDERGIRVDVVSTPQQIIDRIVADHAAQKEEPA